MTEKHNEKPQIEDQSDSTAVDTMAETTSTEKKSVFYTFSVITFAIAITGITAAAIWFNQDKILSSDIYAKSVALSENTIEIVSDGYSSLLEKINTDNSVAATDATESNVTETVETVAPAPVIYDNDKHEHNKDTLIVETVTIEKTEPAAELTDVNNQLPPAEVITETVELEVVKTQDIPVANTTEETSEIQTVQSDVVETLPAETSKTDTLSANKPVEATSVAKKPTVNTPVIIYPPRPVQRPRGYTYAVTPYAYSGPAPQAVLNNTLMQRNNMFEQNMRMQREMIQQAYNMQTAMLNDANRRHQEMLKRVSEWRNQAQERCRTANEKYRQQFQ